MLYTKATVFQRVITDLALVNVGVVRPVACFRNAALLLELCSGDFVFAPGEEAFNCGSVIDGEGGVLANAMGIG